MKNFSLFSLLLLELALFSLLIGTSCTRRDLEYLPDTGLVNIHFDWKNLWPNDTIPSGMNLLFFNNNGEVILKTSNGSDFSDYLPYGSYQIAIYNNDALNVNYKNTKYYSTAGAYTPNIPNSSALLSQPFYSYGLGIDSLTVSQQDVNKTVAPAAFIKKINIKIIITGERDAVTACPSSLSSIIKGVVISSGVPDQTGGFGTIAFDPKITSDGFESTLTLFGKATSQTNILKLNLQYSNGGNQIINIDVSPALKDINTLTNEVTIYVNLDITGSVSSGLTATLKYWSSVDRQATVE